MNIVSYSSHFAALAKAAPASPMVTVVSTTGSVVESVTWAEAETRSTVLAHALKHAGCSLGDYVTIALPNSVDFVISALAAWKLGAVPQPVSAGLPARELDAIVELADSRAVIGVAAASPMRASREGDESKMARTANAYSLSSVVTAS